MLKLSILISAVQAATPGETMIGTVALPTGYPLAITAVTAGSPVGINFSPGGGYSCIRQGFFWTFPGTNDATPVALVTTTSGTVRTFYQSKDSELGTVATIELGTVTD